MPLHTDPGTHAIILEGERNDMQPSSLYESSTGKDVFDDEATLARVRTCKERLTERLRASSLVPERRPSQEATRVRPGNRASHPPALDRIPLVRWDDSANHYLGSNNARSSTTSQRLHEFLKTRRYEEFRDELARAELAQELSEFHALNFQAILAVIEGSEFASDYLEMAEAVAASPYERAVIAENRAAHDLLRGNPVAAAEHCLATLDRVYQTEGLWNNLLIALYRLGDMETIDATLQRFTQLDDDCTARLVRLLSSEPDLHDIRARPAFRDLLNKQAAGQANCIAGYHDTHV